MKRNLKISLKILLFLSILTGLVYPMAMTIVSIVFFPHQSSGSMMFLNGKTIGSELIGQNFTDAKYFIPRPSAISYSPLPSGASNLGPTSSALKDSVEQRRKKFIEINGSPEGTHVPEDALFSSASGVDPHISVQNALLQLNRVAAVRKFDKIKRNKLRELINRLIEKPQFGILGEERINVLKLNIELDKL